METMSLEGPNVLTIPARVRARCLLPVTEEVVKLSPKKSKPNLEPNASPVAFLMNELSGSLPPIPSEGNSELRTRSVVMDTFHPTPARSHADAHTLSEHSIAFTGTGFLMNVRSPDNLETQVRSWVGQLYNHHKLPTHSNERTVQEILQFNKDHKDSTVYVLARATRHLANNISGNVVATYGRCRHIMEEAFPKQLSTQRRAKR